MPTPKETIDINLELQQLKTLLSKAKAEEHLEAIKQGFERIKQAYSLDNEAQVAALTQFAEDCVRDLASSWSEAVLHQFFQGAALWSIPSTMEALERLIPFFKYFTWRFKDWCLYTNIFGRGSFSPRAQEEYIIPLLGHFAGGRFAEAVSGNDYDIRAAALLLYGLSLLDANKPNPMLAKMAGEMFASLKSNAQSKLRNNTSDFAAMYHAFNYFKAKNPNSLIWHQGPLKPYFDHHAKSLSQPQYIRDVCLRSKTQSAIYARLKQLDSNAQRGFFDAGTGNIVNMAANGVKILYSTKPTSADRLAFKTLEKTGPAILITGAAWQACSQGKDSKQTRQAQLDFLQISLADAVTRGVQKPFFLELSAAETATTQDPEQKMAYNG